MRKNLVERYGHWAVITGASSGIGREFAALLAEAGMNLVITARGRDTLTSLADTLATEHGVEVRVITADLQTPAGATELEDGTVDLDIGLLVASAGFGSSGPFIDASLATERSMLAVNCDALLTMTHTFANRFRRRGRGALVLLGSVVGFQGAPMSAHYAATKAYVQSLAEALHLELRTHGVDVISAAPGPVHTGFAKRAGMDLGRALEPRVVARQTLSALGKRMTVRPGWLSKLLGWSLATAPRFMRVRIMGKVMAGMSSGPSGVH